MNRSNPSSIRMRWPDLQRHRRSVDRIAETDPSILADNLRPLNDQRHLPISIGIPPGAVDGLDTCPSRIFGPHRSPSTAIGFSHRAAAFANPFRSVSRWASNVPCEKFNRHTFTPASKSRSKVSTSPQAGPIVATILVRIICSPAAPADSTTPRLAHGGNAILSYGSSL